MYNDEVEMNKTLTEVAFIIVAIDDFYSRNYIHTRSWSHVTNINYL